VVYAADELRCNEVYGNGVWTWFEQHYGRRYPWDAFGYHIYTTLYGPAVASSTVSSYLMPSPRRARRTGTEPDLDDRVRLVTPQVVEARRPPISDTELSVLESRADVGPHFVFRVNE